MGSIERFSAVLIEHLGGQFPLWLSPEQARIIPVADVHVAYADEVHTALKAAGLRTSVAADNDSMGKKIRGAKNDKLPYFIVIGDKEVAERTVTLEKRDGTNEVLTLDALVVKLRTENESRQS